MDIGSELAELLTNESRVHSMSLTAVQVLNGALLQQTFVVEFTVHSQMCDDCHRVEAKDYWRSCVQLRQKVYTNECSFMHFTVHLCSTKIVGRMGCLLPGTETGIRFLLCDAAMLACSWES